MVNCLAVKILGQTMHFHFHVANDEELIVNDSSDEDSEDNSIVVLNIFIT